MTKSIRCLLIKTNTTPLLLPNANVAEVIGYADPLQIEKMPNWMLGQILWRGWRLPLISVSLIARLSKHATTKRARIAIVKTLSNHSKMPFIGIRSQGFPRLITVNQPDIIVSDVELPSGIAANIRIKQETMLIPDLMFIEKQLRQKLNLS